MNKQSNTMKKMGLWLLAAVVLAALLGAVLLAREPAEPTEPVGPTEPPASLTVREDQNIDLGQGLVIERIDRYSGIYMEDGSNDVVQDVMMLLLRNDSGSDLQLARIDLECGGTAAEFEVTNLPAGERVVLLERNRMAYRDDPVDSAAARNVVFFPEPMALEQDRLELSGEAGLVRVTNLSGGELAAPIYVYYKNAAADLYYGGITYRVTISQPLAAGETVTIPVGHYEPDSCRFLMAECGG